MKELNEMELAFVSGGQADFSGVTSTVDSTEEIISPISAALRWLGSSPGDVFFGN